MESRPPKIALVIPCYNEQEVLEVSNRTLTGFLRVLMGEEAISADSYILYVDDGSRDRTWTLIKSFAEADGSVAGLKLASNVGFQNAIIAGLEEVAADCDAAITLDADLQDDVEAVREMVAKFREGYDVVYGVRSDRGSDSWFKRESAQTFYKVLKALGVDAIYNHADFRLMSSATVRDFLRYGERNIYIRGIVPSLGRRQCSVSYVRRPRIAGKSKYPLAKMLNFAVDGITSFSVRPVRMVFCLGVGFIMVALGIFIYVMVRHFTGETLEGWTSLMLSIWFCTGVILLSLGIIGEYVGKIYTEVKHRPRYGIEKKTERARSVSDD